MALSRLFAACSLLLVAGCALAAAQPGQPRPGSPLYGQRPQMGEPSAGLPAPLREVRIEQRLNEQVPLDLPFRDETGRVVKFGEFFNGKPVILALVFYKCPMLCNQVLDGLARSLKAQSFTAGREFDVVTVSFDPRETPELAREKKETYLQKYRRAGAETGWHFLTGDAASIKSLTEAVGFHYAYDPKTDQFAHASGIMVLTPQGRLSRYFYGIEYAPRDLRLGLVEAADNRIGSPVDQLLLYCYHYDPATGTYGPVVLNIIRLGGIITLFGIGALILILRRREAGRGGSVRAGGAV